MAAKKSPSTDEALRALRAFGLTYPGAHTKSPWPGHLDLAVNDKTFAYLSIEGEPFKISCKLPRSHEVAMMIDGVTPTAYGLGKSGWVTATFADGAVPVDLLKDWIDESYRAQAPKRLVASLPLASLPAKRDAAKKQGAAKNSPAKKSPAKNSPAKNSAAKNSAAKRSAPKKAAARAKRSRT